MPNEPSEVSEATEVTIESPEQSAQLSAQGFLSYLKVFLPLGVAFLCASVVFTLFFSHWFFVGIARTFGQFFLMGTVAQVFFSMTVAQVLASIVAAIFTPVQTFQWCKRNPGYAVLFFLVSPLVLLSGPALLASALFFPVMVPAASFFLNSFYLVLMAFGGFFHGCAFAMFHQHKLSDEQYNSYVWQAWKGTDIEESEHAEDSVPSYASEDQQGLSDSFIVERVDTSEPLFATTGILRRALANESDHQSSAQPPNQQDDQCEDDSDNVLVSSPKDTPPRTETSDDIAGYLSDLFPAEGHVVVTDPRLPASYVLSPHASAMVEQADEAVASKAQHPAIVPVPDEKQALPELPSTSSAPSNGIVDSIETLRV